MGERGNIQINGVNFYTHWSGYRTKEIVANALDRGRSRWDDAPYLARIIFCELVADRYIEEDGIDNEGLVDELLDTINFGISAGEELDMNYDTVEVGHGFVRVGEETLPFEKFIAKYGEGKH